MFLVVDYLYLVDNIFLLVVVVQQFGVCGVELICGLVIVYEIYIDLICGICLYEYKIDYVVYLGLVVVVGIGIMLWFD